MTDLDMMIERSLRGFVKAINEDKWSGRREREAICLYVLAHLRLEVKRGSILSDIRQIGIEMPVEQIDPTKQKALSGGTGKPKADVTKDLLIWPRPQMTTWNTEGKSHGVPLAILEWKMGSLSPSEYDVRWLEHYSRGRDRFTGYAVSFHRSKSGVFSLAVTRVKQGKHEVDWLVCNGTPAP